MDAEQPGGPANGGDDRAGLFDGFEGYRTTTDETYQHALSTGTVVPDTNVFLNLYRYNAQARFDLLAVLGRLGDRLWVPHQVMTEFWRNRESAIRDPEEAAEGALDGLEKQRQASSQVLRAWANRVALAPAEVDELQTGLDRGFGPIEEAIATSIDLEATRQFLDTNTDPVVRALGQLLAGKVGAPLSATDREACVEEGRKRLEAGTPPGFMDLKKDRKGDAEASLGDYFIWEQILREAERRGLDVVIVTGDVKEDWWRRVNGETRGPRVELVDEMRTRAGVRLLMLRPESLLARARLALHVEVREETLQDVVRVDRFTSMRDMEGWTSKAAQQLLARLKTEAPVQAEAIALAARQGGFVRREDVYSLGEYDQSRTLRGFTRPANRIAQDLRDSGVLPETAPDPLEAVYDPGFSWVLARGFRIPTELVDMLRESREAEVNEKPLTEST